MDAVFLKLINMSIAASWLILAVIVVRMFLKKVPKWISCMLWALVAVRLLCPFSVESFFSLIPSAETIPADIIYSQEPSIHSGISYLNSTVNPIISDSLAPQPGDSVNPVQIWIFVGTIIWLTGAGILLIYAVVSYLRLRYKVRFAVRMQNDTRTAGMKAGGAWGDGPQQGSEEHSGQQEAGSSILSRAGQIGVPGVSRWRLKRVTLWQSESVESPFILGAISPRIYLPFDIEEKQLDCVMAHEIAHLVRGDHWWKPLGFILLCIHWFNPFCWVAYVLLCKDIELACDEKVVKNMTGSEKKGYSDALLFGNVNRRTIAACPLAFGEVGVKDRVWNVLHYKKPAFWIIILTMLICLAVALCFLTNPDNDVDSELPNLRGESYDVIDAVYEDLAFSSIYTVSEGADYYITQEGHLLSKLGVPGSNGGWQDVGELSEFVLDKTNFDEYFTNYGAFGWQNGVSARKIRTENVNAWYIIEEKTIEESTLSILYYVLQQKNGDVYLAYGYVNEPEQENMIRWLFELSEVSPEQLPDGYSLEDALKDGCVVMADGDVMSGQDVWAEFVETSAAGNPAAVRIAMYYTLGDKSQYDEEYYESIKDEYPKLYIEDLCYDGDKYTVSYYEEGRLYVSEYEYLVRYEGEPTSPYAVFDKYVRYVLVNDNTVTWEEIERGMFSSQLGDGIAHTSVYVDLE